MKEETRKTIGFTLGILIFVLFAFVLKFDPEHPSVGRMAGVAGLMAVWWMTEALPIPVTSLVPLVLVPALGIMKAKEIAPNYGNSKIFLFMGGFIIALAMERWNLHRRIALHTIRLIGDKPSRVILGFMVATAFISMWISNTATTMMMLPIAMSVIASVSGLEDTVEKGAVTSGFAVALLLGIAYSASIGGIATLIGTPPNIVFSRVFTEVFPGAGEITFFQWFIMALPFSVIFLFITWLFLVIFMVGRKGDRLLGTGGGKVIDREIAALGEMSYEEKAVLVIFVTTAFLWLFRSDIVIGAFRVPGWAGLVGMKGFIDDGTVGMTMALLLFIIPAGKNREISRLMDWETALRMPWGIILLFGGGFALADGFMHSGLAAWIGNAFKGVDTSSPALLILGTSLIITFLTELTSNTAITQLVLPIIASTSVGLGVNPLLLMIPATMSASCAFMLPVATPPNAIVFGSGRIKMGSMVKAGIILNIIGAFLVLAFVYLVTIPAFGIDPHSLPSWASLHG